MKKSFLALASFAAIAVGCQVEPVVDLPVVEDAVVYRAVTEAYDSATKTAMSDLDVVWSADDQISVFEGWNVPSVYTVASESVGSTTAEFTVSSPANVDEEWDTSLDVNAAIYPASEYAMIFPEEVMDEDTWEYYATGNYVFRGVVIPKVQEYVAGSFANGAFPMVAITESVEDNTFEFKNILGAVKLQLVGTKTIKSIQLNGLNEENLVGNVQNVIYGPDCEPTLEFSYMDRPVSSVVIDCGEGVQLNSETATDFVFAVAPTVFEYGFSVVIKDVDGNVYNASASDESEVKRSRILVMPELNVDELPMVPFVDVDVTVTSVPDITDVELSISLETEDDDVLEGFYGIFLQNGNAWDEIKYMIEELGYFTFNDFLDGAMGSEVPVCLYTGTSYTGNLSEFGWTEEYLEEGDHNIIQPNVDYQVAIVPVIKGKSEYTTEDAQIFDTPTLSLTTGGNIATPEINVAEGYLKSVVTVNVSDDVVYAKYMVVKPGEACPTEEDYLETVTYEPDFTAGDESFDVVVGPDTKILPGATCTLCVMLVDETAKSSFFTFNVSTKALPKDDTAVATVVKAEYDDAQDDDLTNDVVYAKVSYPSNAAAIYYLASTAGNFNDHGKAEAQAKILEGTTAWKHVEITDESPENVIIEAAPVGNAWGDHTECICFIVLTKEGKVGPLTKTDAISVPKRK